MLKSELEAAYKELNGENALLKSELAELKAELSECKDNGTDNQEDVDGVYMELYHNAMGILEDIAVRNPYVRQALVEVERSEKNFSKPW